MFEFLKAKNTAILDENAIQTALADYRVNGEPLSQYLAQIKTHGTSLTLDLRLPDDCNPEQIHHELSQKLHLLGVSEINMNITLFRQEKPNSASPQHNHKASSSTLPKVTDAMVNSQSIKQQAVIQKEPPLCLS